MFQAAVRVLLVSDKNSPQPTRASVAPFDYQDDWKCVRVVTHAE